MANPTDMPKHVQEKVAALVGVIDTLHERQHGKPIANPLDDKIAGALAGLTSTIKLDTVLPKPMEVAALKNQDMQLADPNKGIV